MYWTYYIHWVLVFLSHFTLLHWCVFYTPGPWRPAPLTASGIYSSPRHPLLSSHIPLWPLSPGLSFPLPRWTEGPAGPCCQTGALKQGASDCCSGFNTEKLGADSEKWNLEVGRCVCALMWQGHTPPWVVVVGFNSLWNRPHVFVKVLIISLL